MNADTRPATVVGSGAIDAPAHSTPPLPFRCWGKLLRDDARRKVRLVRQPKLARRGGWRLEGTKEVIPEREDLAGAAAMAKCYATDVAMRVATDAVQLFGAAGVSAEYPINRYFRDAKVLQIIEGTNQIQRNIIANSVLGRTPSRHQPR